MQSKKRKLSETAAPHSIGQQTVSRHRKEINFVEMNEDCIEEILRRLPIADIEAMAMVNQRISFIAKDLFRRIHGDNLLTCKTPTTHTKSSNQRIWQQQRYLGSS